MTWEIVVGLEVHAQLSTQTKLFSGAATLFGAAPNSQASAVDIALPGVLPVPNRAAVEKAIRVGLALDGKIARRSVFARKNYFYPDLPKGYQISQYELPIISGGALKIDLDGIAKTVSLTRAHLEEDAGKSLHEDFHGLSGIDLNRAGTPLLEIVSEPELRGAREAVSYAKTLHSLLRYLDVCDGNMQEGSFRCDANVSVRTSGSAKLGTRCEIKNLNSFRYLERAIEYEARRQIEILEDGGQITQETRLYDPERDETRPMRSKEDAHDYRYFPDPDLLPLEVSDAWIEQVRSTLPELPDAKRARFVLEYGLSAYDAGVLTATRELAAYFEQTVAASGAEAKLCANWISGELLGTLNDAGLEITQSKISSASLAGLLKLMRDGAVSGKIAKDVFAAMWAGQGEAESIIEAKGLKQISDVSELERIVDAVLSANPAQVAEYRSGKQKVFAFLIGQAMKASAGRAHPSQLNEILRRKLAS
jgi:aspartyl-tRNA(Asn)/glutamyl-tRNA(Gln) amidotransferase subunit B